MTKAQIIPGILYMVSTPIGNLEDLSYRAKRILESVDWIAAEDTRETTKLLQSYGIRTPLHSLHEHSDQKRIEDLVGRLSDGGQGAYVSDAGTPGICDPGASLVEAAAKIGIQVVPVPGSSALAALLSVSGFSFTSFSFHGFFPRENRDRNLLKERMNILGGVQVFFETPHRIRSCLDFLSLNFSSAKLVVGRELTKKFETLTRGSVQEVAEKIGQEEPRGEYVLALELPSPEEKSGGLKTTEVEALLWDLFSLGANQKTLVRVAMSHGVSKNLSYEMALKASKGDSKP